MTQVDVEGIGNGLEGLISTISSTVAGARRRSQAIDVREAFNLWDIAKSKYHILDLFHSLRNDAHDPDLKLMLGRFTNDIEAEVKNYEQLLERFSIMSPDRNRAYVNYPGNMGAVTDEQIARELLLWHQEEAERLIRGFVTSLTNDEVRGAIKETLLSKVNDVDDLIRYLTLKDWIGTPPMYKNIPRTLKEGITVAEVGILWDHLTFRYDNANTTEVMLSFAKDRDSALLLSMGLKTLEKQIATLEKELQRFAIPLPSRPGKVTMKPLNQEVLHDDHMYRTLFIGLQGAMRLHVQPLKEAVYNDRIRSLFTRLLVEEIELADGFFKYGKLKGWLHPVPMYQ